MKEIVIKIPEDVYKKTIFYREFKDLNDCVTTIKALENATPLPKGHGRLFDERDIVNGNYEIIGNRIYGLEPIIEADKESEK